VQEKITRRYKFDKTLGEGAFGKVKIAWLHQNPDKKYAIKSIPRSLLDNRLKDVANASSSQLRQPISRAHSH